MFSKLLQIFEETTLFHKINNIKSFPLLPNGENTQKINNYNENIKINFFGLKDIWYLIFKYIDKFDAIALKQTNRTFQSYSKQFIKDIVVDEDLLQCINNMKKYRWVYANRYYKRYYYKNIDHYKKNELGCIRLSTMLFLIDYAANKLGKHYIAQYIPETQRLLPVSQNWLQTCAYNAIPCYGQFYLLSNLIKPPTKKHYNIKQMTTFLHNYLGYCHSSIDSDNNNILLNDLFKKNIDLTRLNSGLPTEKTVTSYKCELNTYIKCPDCGDQTDYSEYVFKINRHCLIFNFSNNDINITKIKTCDTMNSCYTIDFPKKVFNYPSYKSQGVEKIIDKEIIKKDLWGKDFNYRPLCKCDKKEIENNMFSKKTIKKEEIVDIEIISKKKEVRTLKNIHICVAKCASNSGYVHIIDIKN
jgi:hypothetical protein